MLKDQTELLNKVLRGDPFAISFCSIIWGVSQVWDDLVDKDRELTANDINKTMWDLLVTLPNNPFYRDNFDILNPLVQSAIVDWLDSNDLVNGNTESKVVAYVLRDSISTIIIHCARIIGGFDWMREISIEVREALYDEPIENYLGDLPNV